MILFTISLLLPAFISAETVYKTRDAEGNIIFSDVPSEGAETIEIEAVQTVNIPAVKEIDNRPAEKLIPEETVYTQFELVSPENDSTIRSNEGIVKVNLQMTPVLDEKHNIVYSMDGKEISSGKYLQLTLSNVDRGTHNISASVMNENDEVIKRSNKLVFHLRKDSKLFKNRNKPDANSDNSTNIVPDSPTAGADPAPASPKIPAL